jgi:hypothetical protein
MRVARSICILVAIWVVIAACASAHAQTCFRACLTPRLKSSDITDDMIRYQMTLCRDACEDESQAKLAQLGLDRKMAACEPAPESDAEFKSLRSASASFLTFANTFTWDIHNVLPGKVIRKVEIVYPTLDLDETTATGGGTVLPGETATLFINGVFEGYPAMRYGLRVKAVHACSID